MDINTLGEMFSKIFNRKELEKMARDMGFLKRLRDIHPLEFVLSVVACAIGDETRSIACARRLFYGVSGHMPEESSYYDRFNREAAEFMKHLFLKAQERCTAKERQDLVEALGGSGILDILAADSTQITLPESAAWAFPSTSEYHGGIKITATLSILFQKVKRIEITDAVTHDRRALKLDRWLHGVLLLLDLGYFDHKLFADIERRGGFFISRLKENSFPVVEKIRSGLGQIHLGEVLDGDLPYRTTVDVDASFKVSGQEPRSFRVLRIPVLVEDEYGRSYRDYVWFVTNVPAQLFSSEAISILYRYRWEIGVSSQGHIIQSVKVRPRLTDQGLVAWEAPWRESKTVKPSDNILRKEDEQSTRLQRIVNADVASLHANPVAETVYNVRKQQGPCEMGLIRRLSPAGYQRRHGAKDYVSTGEALGVRRRKLVEEACPITVSGKWVCRHQGDGSGRSTFDRRAAKHVGREGPGPVGIPFVQSEAGVR